MNDLHVWAGYALTVWIAALLLTAMRVIARRRPGRPEPIDEPGGYDWDAIDRLTTDTPEPDDDEWTDADDAALTTWLETSQDA